MSVDGARRSARRASRMPPSDGEPYRLVLTDALMPDVDGFALGARDQGRSRGSKATRLILLTVGLRRAGLDARGRRFSAVLEQARQAVRPARRDRRVCSAAAQADQRFSGGRARPPPPRRRTRPLRILVAEDNPTNQKLVVALFEQRTTRVVIASERSRSGRALGRASLRS